MARCLLKSMGVPGQFWGEAVKTAAYLLNRSPTKSLNGKTPFEVWFGRKPNVRHLRTFGCTAYAKRIGPGVNKLVDRSLPGVFLGYEPGMKGYRVFDPVSGKLVLSRDVIFDEQRRWNWEEKATGINQFAPQFTVVYSDRPEADQNPTIGLLPNQTEEFQDFQAGDQGDVADD